MNRVVRAAGVVAVVLAQTASVGSAQTWQTTTGSRQVRGEKQLRVELEYAAGRLELMAGNPATLYRSHIRYDADLFESRTEYDAPAGRLHIGVTADDLPEDVDLDSYPQALQLALSPTVPLILDLEFGMAIADLDLGGLALSSAHVKTGGSESRIVFSAPNRVACDRLEIAVGAAELLVAQLGNARCRHIEFTGGVGGMVLDFTGSWSQNSHTSADVTVGLGSLTLRLPSDVGISIEMTKFLASFEEQGFEKSGSRLVSTNYDRAPAKLDIELHAVLGDVNVEWVSGG
jgi:hypothetical protein